jgi:hypothetical protein
LHTDGRVLDVNEAAFDDEIIAWNFQIELALHQLRIRHLDFGAPLGKIDDSTGKALAALKRDRDRLKVRPRAECSVVLSSFYRQDILDVGVHWNLAVQPLHPAQNKPLSAVAKPSVIL